MHYSDFQQSQMDQESGAEMDRRDARKRLIEEKVRLRDWCQKTRHFPEAVEQFEDVQIRIDEIDAEPAKLDVR